MQNELERGRNRARWVRRRVQYPRDSTVVRWKLEQGVVQPTWTDLVLLIAFLIQNFFFNILLHVPCDFMGHIWLFSTVKGCVLWLIKMCPKYMVYFFRIWTEKNQFNSKSWLVLPVWWEQRLVEPLSHDCSQTVVDLRYYRSSSLGRKGRLSIAFQRGTNSDM